jgi:hypothetical protein
MTTKTRVPWFFLLSIGGVGLVTALILLLPRLLPEQEVFDVTVVLPTLPNEDHCYRVNRRSVLSFLLISADVSRIPLAECDSNQTIILTEDCPWKDSREVCTELLKNGLASVENMTEERIYELIEQQKTAPE